MNPPRIPTVMLIDDEGFDQKMYQRVIARSGLVGRVLPFLYADEALAFLKTPGRDPVDVIFLDINMPRMNGFEFLTAATRDIGADLARIVVIMLTTSLEPRDRERARAFPVVRGFINKPLTGQHLLQIADLLESGVVAAGVMI
jgi:CheY-like chemotaxis protein